MQLVKKGDTVHVHYTGKLTSGEPFDSSDGKEPLKFEVGAGMMIKGFDDAVAGMTIGEKKTVHIAAADGYGERNEEMLIEFPRSNFPEDMKPEVGMQLSMNNNAGQQFPVTITEVGNEVVKLDANHFLAGKELVFDIEIMEIDSKSLIIMP